MKRVLLLLANGFEAYEASVFTDVLGWATVFGDTPIEVKTAGRRSELKCTWNLTVIPEIYVSEVDVIQYEALALPGGFEKAGFYEDAYHEDFLRLIRAFDKEKKIIASICVGPLPLGKSGILKGRKATTYHLLDGIRKKQLADFKAKVVDNHIVVDENIITSSSPATALDVAFKLLEMLSSKENCTKIKKLMGF